jgi:hypothetical protein
MLKTCESTTIAKDSSEHLRGAQAVQLTDRFDHGVLLIEGIKANTNNEIQHKQDDRYVIDRYDLVSFNLFKRYETIRFF